ncbi:prophage tail fiber N-terminal domain-containing protein, partial [Brenneria corticis]
MSVLISGVLVTPAGVPVPNAEITFTALTNGDSVLNGFSASITTDAAGAYSIPLELCSYSISIQANGQNMLYGSVSITNDTTPSTINDLLAQAALEQSITPQIIVYFQEIQTDVTAKLATMQTLSTSATNAAAAAASARDAAAQYAANLSAAVTAAQNASASATTAANSATAAKDAAEAAAANAQNTLDSTMKKSANLSDLADVAESRANLGL